MLPSTQRSSEELTDFNDQVFLILPSLCLRGSAGTPFCLDKLGLLLHEGNNF
jgi:hypothetical protein